MTDSQATQAQTPSPAFPDYMLEPNAVLKDNCDSWRYGRAPDYSRTRTFYEETKSKSHEPDSLAHLAENLIKNWEIEASFKTELKDMRVIDNDHYSFHINGGPSQSAEEMLKKGTYNAIISSNEFYCPAYSDFATSHKTFKQMMPTFAFEVIETYGAPPVVGVRWRHWGVMKNDYVGFNDKGEKITAKAHGGPIDIQGVTVATLGPDFRVRKLETWFDPLEMFRQIAPKGIVNKVTIPEKPSLKRKGTSFDLRSETVSPTLRRDSLLTEKTSQSDENGKSNIVSDVGMSTASVGTEDISDRQSSLGNKVIAQQDLEHGEARAAAEEVPETKVVKEEMKQDSARHCPFLNAE